MDGYGRPVNPLMSRTGRRILMWVGIALGTGVAYVIISKQVRKGMERGKAKQKVKDIEHELTEIQKKEKLSYPQSEYNAMSSKLTKSFDGCGTSDKQVEAVFKKLNNNADLLKLKAIFGISKWDGCNWTGDFGDEEGTLDDAISAEMSQSEISHLNKILEAKGIVYRF